MYIYSAAFSYYITQCGILIYITFLDLTHFSVYSDSVDCARYTQHGMEHTMDRGRAVFHCVDNARYCNIMVVSCRCHGVDTCVMDRPVYFSVDCEVRAITAYYIYTK
jgi:hypothetical protein